MDSARIQTISEETASKKDMKWKVNSPYGDIDITINLSKPEKDPKAIAAAKKMQSKVLIQSVSFVWKMKDMQEE